MGDVRNLNPVRTKEEARRRGRLGGLAKAKKDRERRNLQEALKALLAMENENGGSNLEQIAIALLRKGLSGDTRAIEVLRDTAYGKPSVHAEIDEQHSVKLVLFGDEVTEDKPTDTEEA